MNAPLRPPADVGDRDQVVTFTPGMRRLIADAIESLILLLDEIDGDADFEEEPDAEDGGDDEPSLGSTHDVDQQKGWARPHGPYDPEAEFDGDGVRCADDEPSLGATVAFDQREAWAPANRAFCADGEASGTADDIPTPRPTTERRDAQAAAARETAEEALQALLRRSGGRPVRIGPELILLGACDALGRVLQR